MPVQIAEFRSRSPPKREVNAARSIARLGGQRSAGGARSVLPLEGNLDRSAARRWDDRPVETAGGLHPEPRLVIVQILDTALGRGQDIERSLRN